MMKFNNQNGKDLLATLATQLWKLISGPITMLFIPIFLSPEQQGYWYLFGSISALSIFADLGFSNIILQFSAHEYAYLHFNEKRLLEGDVNHLNKLGSFFGFTLKWISTISVIVFPIIFIVGLYFFYRDGVLAVYLLPWFLYSIGSLLNFFNGSILSFIEGLNKIEEVQKIRFKVALINTSIIVLILLLRGNIYALAISILFSSSFIFISIFGKFKPFLFQLLELSKKIKYSWRKEVLPLFMKYALSFSSGYFIFQIYTPLMHYFHGPILSGKVGISISLVTAIFNISNIWMYTITPQINMFVSKQEWKSLDAVFNKRLWLSLGTYLFIGICVIVFLMIFGDFWIVPKVVDRFLTFKSIIILYLCYFIQLIINSFALYLRGHKKEPFMIISIISAIWIAVVTIIVGKFLPSDYFFFGFFSMQIIGLPICYMIFNICKKKWHIYNSEENNQSE